MTDEDKPRRQPVQPGKFDLPAPRPRSAAASYPQLIPDGHSRGRPVAPSAPMPTKDPVRQKLEYDAELRRKLLRQAEQESRDGQAREHAEADALHNKKLDRAGVTGIQRIAADANHAEGHQSEVAMLDEYFAEQWTALETTIAEAFDQGYFADEVAAAIDRAAGRHAEREAGRGDDGSGGRELGD